MGLLVRFVYIVLKELPCSSVPVILLASLQPNSKTILTLEKSLPAASHIVPNTTQTMIQQINSENSFSLLKTCQSRCSLIWNPNKNFFFLSSHKQRLFFLLSNSSGELCSLRESATWNLSSYVGTAVQIIASDRCTPDKGSKEISITFALWCLIPYLRKRIGP